ncbi:MAG: hypothetical protein HY231_12080 [Acidobacteria bacterium]|nr:hypothetical protein [Acidobacteriota bacterium]
MTGTEKCRFLLGGFLTSSSFYTSTDERTRRDLGVYFLMRGGLRYNRGEVLELTVERGMIPYKELKDSSFYQ